jgi:ATP-dependent Clp protease ATP-binding subunit ClpC
MASSRSQDELSSICKTAESVASRRKERLSTLHLLIALVQEGAAASLLDDHRLGGQKIELLSLSGTPEEDPELARRAVQLARELAVRTKAKSPGSQHLLLALLNERRSAAFLLLERSGVDAALLRRSAMQVAVGATVPRRLSAPAAPAPPPRAARSAARPATAIPVSTVPRMPRPEGDARPARTDLLAETRPARTDLLAETRPARPDLLAETRPARPDLLAETRQPRLDALAESRPGAPPPEGPAEPPAEVAPRSTAVPVDLMPPRAPRDSTPPPPRAPVGPGVLVPVTPQGRFQLDPQRFPVLSALGQNLSLAAARGELPAVLGRDREIEQCLDVLAKRHANNPVLVGVPGVGKTSILRGIAARVLASRPGSPDDRILLELTPAQLAAGTGMRGQLAERVVAIRKEVMASEGRVVLVFDDLHQLLAGELDGEAGAELRQAFARGELPCVGATTPEDLRRLVESDPALARRFTVVAVDEPPRDEALAIAQQAAAGLGGHHGVRFSPEALAASVDWSVRFLPGRALPDKALGVLDLAGARARRRGLGEVKPELIAGVIGEASEVPPERMLETDADRMLGLESLFASSVVGHGPALTRIARILRRNAAGIRGRRPIGTFLLLGPTGVGKTETAKAIARALFHSPDAMTRLDMSEYSEAHAVARLIGAPPGYIGHESGGQLTEAIRRRPYQVILLDEIEKANRDVLEAFLGVFDEGRLTDGRGKTVDFSNAVLVLTSNLGASVALGSSAKSIGFQRMSPVSEPQVDTAAVVAAAREALPPELYNRLDEVLVFAPLSRADLQEICRRLLAALGRTLAASRGLTLVVADEVPDAILAAGGYEPELGARPVKRTIARLIEGPLAEIILQGQGQGATIRISAPDGQIQVDRVP